MSQKYILGQRAQTRKRSARYVAAVTAVLLVLAVVQVSFFGRFRIFGAVPDLMIVAILCIGFFTGPYTGAVSSIGAGFLIDALGASGLSILPVCYLFEGYLTGYYGRRAPTRGFLQYLVYLGITLIYRAAITVLYACLYYQNLRLPTVLIESVLPELIGTAIMGLVFYLPMRVLCGWLEKKL